MPLSWGGCSARPPRWLYEHVSIARIDLQITSMCSHVRQLFARIEDGQFSYCWLRYDLVCRRHSLVVSGITPLFPIDRINGGDYSYRSRGNNPFGSSPTPFPSIVHSYWLLGVFPDQGSLTKVDKSLEFVPAFRYSICSCCKSMRCRPIRMLSLASGALRSPLIYPANRNRSDGRPRRIQCCKQGLLS